MVIDTGGSVRVWLTVRNNPIETAIFHHRLGLRRHPNTRTKNAKAESLPKARATSKHTIDTMYALRVEESSSAVMSDACFPIEFCAPHMHIESTARVGN